MDDPDRKNKYHWQTDNVTSKMVIYVIVSVVWIIIAYYLLYKPIRTLFSGYLKGIVVAILSVPVLIFGNNVYKSAAYKQLTDVPTDYSICLTPESQLSIEEKEYGAVGKIDYSCLRNQYDMQKSRAIGIQNQSYNLIYSLFTLILLLFTIKRTKQIIRNEDIFIRNAIMSSMMFSVLTLLAPLYAEYGWYSININIIFESIFQMNVITVIGLVMYIGYRLMLS